MAIKKHTHARQILLACFIILLIAFTGCKQQNPSPRPLSAKEVKKLSAEIERVSSAYIDAWNKHDTDLMGKLMTENIKYYEAGNYTTANGKLDLLSINSMVLFESPDFGGRQVDTYIGRADGFDIWEMWNYAGSTQDNPYHAYDWYILTKGKISSMWLFWGFEVFARLWTPDHGSTFDQKPLEDYASAWSSGDTETVASLYAPEVDRQDTLFKENQQGSSAVKEFATNFYTWYPGVRLELLQSFKLGDSTPVKTGGVYAMHVTDLAGKPCDVRAIILLEISKDQITHEWLFYNADSLIACGWAQ